jgi:hypothetical protein
MRIRSIRPEFWSSEDVAAMDWFTRLVFIGLWSYVDDNGVGRDVEALIVAALFPLDGDLPEASRRVTGALRHLSEHGQITRYRVDDKAYLFINAWKKHQRIEKASAGRYPLPTSENAEIAEPSPTIPGALLEPSPPGEGAKGRRGEGDSTASRKRGRRIPDDFTVTDDMRQWASDNGFAHLELDKLTTEFRDYWAAESGQRSVKLDWVKTWRNRVRAVAERTPGNVRTLRAPSPDGKLTPAQVDEILGQDRWTPPPAPPGYDPDEAWVWDRDRRVEHLAERQEQARRALSGGVA